MLVYAGDSGFLSYRLTTRAKKGVGSFIWLADAFVAGPILRSGKHGLLRLQFNKLGYEIFKKTLSRRVPAMREPGNFG